MTRRIKSTITNHKSNIVYIPFHFGCTQVKGRLLQGRTKITKIAQLGSTCVSLDMQHSRTQTSWTLNSCSKPRSRHLRLCCFRNALLARLNGPHFKNLLVCGVQKFFLRAQSTVNRHYGGAAVLVKSSLPCRPAWSHTHKGGSAQAVWVGSTLVISTYLAPNSDAETVSAAVAQTVHSLGSKTSFYFGGDYNATPEEESLSSFLDS